MSSSIALLAVFALSGAMAACPTGYTVTTANAANVLTGCTTAADCSSTSKIVASTTACCTAAPATTAPTGAPTASTPAPTAPTAAPSAAPTAATAAPTASPTPVPTSACTNCCLSAFNAGSACGANFYLNAAATQTALPTVNQANFDSTCCLARATCAQFTAYTTTSSVGAVRPTLAVVALGAIMGLMAMKL